MKKPQALILRRSLIGFVGIQPWCLMLHVWNQSIQFPSIRDLPDARTTSIPVVALQVVLLWSSVLLWGGWSWLLADKMKVEWSKWVLALWSLMGGSFCTLGCIWLGRFWKTIRVWSVRFCSLIRRWTQNMRVKKPTKTSTTLLSGILTWDLSSIQKLPSCRHA